MSPAPLTSSPVIVSPRPLIDSPYSPNSVGSSSGGRGAATKKHAHPAYIGAFITIELQFGKGIAEQDIREPIPVHITAPGDAIAGVEYGGSSFG